MSEHLRQAWAHRIEAGTYTYEVQYAYDKDVLMNKDGFPDREDWSSTVTVEADSEIEARLLAEQMVAARYREPVGIRRIQ